MATAVTTNLYLDTRRTQPGKQALLKITFRKNNETAFLSTNIRIHPGDWGSLRLRAKVPAVQHLIEATSVKVRAIVQDLSAAGKLDGLGVRGIRDAVAKELFPADVAPVRFLDSMRAFAASRKKKRTREIYAATIAKIEAFDKNADTIDFCDISVGWLDRFDAHLAKTSPARNARNIHFRNIRAVFNDALKKGLTTFYPFRMFEIHPEPTAKRALTAEQLRKLFSLQLPDWQQKYLDFFKLSFMLIGMNTEDLCKADAIQGGRLNYIRAKTYKPYSILVEPEAQEIIDKYAGKTRLLNILDHYARVHGWTSKVDNQLKAIAKLAGLPPISMYWTRHSWVTIAINELDIPKETVAAALGHSPSTVTDVYIDFDRAKVDRANREVIDYVLTGKRLRLTYEQFVKLARNIS